MIVVSPSLVIVLTVSVLVLGSLLWILMFRPELGRKIIEESQSPFVAWPAGSRSLLIVMIIFSFICLLCTLCFQLYSLIQLNQP